MSELIEHRGASIDTLRTPAPKQGTAMMNAESERAIAEVQAAMVIAKRFPRDEDAAYTRIQKACRRPALAEAALYAYTKGGSEVSGPSIRLAEELARDWGNITFGWRILSQDEDSTEVRAEAWDLETNVPSYITFTVRHEFKGRDGGQKVMKKVTDPRELYELIANQASRRLRACILRIIPGDVQDMAVDQCEKTLKDGGGKPLGDRVRDMIAFFANDFHVTKEQIEKRVGKKAEAINETEFLSLRRIYGSLKDGAATVEQFFDATAGATGADELKKGPAKEPAAAPASAGGAQVQSAQETTAQQRPSAPAPAAGSEAVARPVVTERGRVLTEIVYTPKLGDNIEFDNLPWRVIEVTDKQVVVRAAERQPEPPKPQPKAGADEKTPVSLQSVINEIMAAEAPADLQEARELAKRLTEEKDRQMVDGLIATKEQHLKAPKRRQRTME